MEKKKPVTSHRRVEMRPFRTYECKVCGFSQKSHKPEKIKHCMRCLKDTPHKLVRKK